MIRPVGSPRPASGSSCRTARPTAHRPGRGDPSRTPCGSLVPSLREARPLGCGPPGTHRPAVVRRPAPRPRPAPAGRQATSARVGQERVPGARPVEGRTRACVRYGRSACRGASPLGRPRRRSARTGPAVGRPRNPPCRACRRHAALTRDLSSLQEKRTRAGVRGRADGSRRVPVAGPYPAHHGRAPAPDRRSRPRDLAAAGITGSVRPGRVLGHHCGEPPPHASPPRACGTAAQPDG